MDEDPHQQTVDLFKNASDNELRYHAGTPDVTAMVEASLRLKNTLQEEEQAIKLLTEKLVSFTKALVRLTWILVVLTAVLVCLEGILHILKFISVPSNKVQTPNVTFLQPTSTQPVSATKHKIQKPSATPPQLRRQMKPKSLNHDK